jgi:hypothetical protein
MVSRCPHSFISILLVVASHTMASKLKPAPTITSEDGAYTTLRMPVSFPVSSACVSSTQQAGRPTTTQRNKEKHPPQ